MNPSTNIHIENNGEEKLAKVISYLLHPLLMPTYGFTLILFTENYISTFIPSDKKLVVLVVTFIFTFLFPAINALILLKMGRIKSLEMETDKERTLPYGSAVLYYFALFYLFNHIQHFPEIFKSMVLGAGLSILFTLLINFKWKISAHTVGIGGITGAALAVIYRLHADVYLLLMMLLFFSGLVAYARLKLNAHTPSQVYSGFALGFLIEFGLMLFY